MDLHLQPKSFLQIFLRTLIYLVLSFIIIWSLFVANEEYDIYTTVPPEIPVYAPPVQEPLTESQKKDVINSLNDSPVKYSPEDAAKELNSIPKPKNTLTDEEKNKILQGLE